MEKVSHTTALSDEKKTTRQHANETIRFVIIALCVIVIFRTFIASPFIVEGPSMDNTFHDNDYLIIDKLSYRFEEPARGDIIVFQYPYDPSMHHIKRIVGLPGDTISVRDNHIEITNPAHPEGVVLSEPFLVPTHNTIPVSDSRTLGPDEYYVMGDNRDVSLDSRRYGALNKSFITGRVLVRLYPFSTLGTFPGFSDDATMTHTEQSTTH